MDNAQLIMKENTIPKGYKQTKLGVIPEDWEEYLFNDIFIFSTGKNIKQNEASVEFNIPCVRYGELYHMYNEVINNVINKTNLDKLELLFSKGDEILLPSAGEDPLDIGSASALTLENIAIGRTINILRPIKKNIYSQKYVAYYINQQLKKEISTLAKGFSISNVYNSDLKKLSINLPPLNEQKRIAQILTTWDKAISNQQLLIDKYKLKKKGLMQKILAPKKDWKEVRLGEVFTLSSGKTKPKETVDIKTNKCQIPVYGGNGISGYSNTVFQTGERILIGRVGEYCGCVHYVEYNYWITDNCLYTKDFLIDADIKFYHFFLEHLKLDRLKNKGGQPLVSQKPILNLKVKIPNLKTQTKIANILSSADKELELLEKQLDKLKEQKKGLMQVLLSGQKRVKVIDN